MFCFGGAYFTILYYLPIYFQSVYNNNPIDSGVKMLALIIPLTLAAMAQGYLLYKIGRVPMFWIVGGALGAIGCGLFYTMDTNTSTGKWIGYQIIVGFTSGLTFQVALSNAQVHTPPEDMSQVTAIINCMWQPRLPRYGFPSDFEHRFRDSWWIVFSLRSTVCLQQPIDQNTCHHYS